MSTPAETVATGPAKSFWRFSLELYAAPKVADACIELQDGSGVDVNVLLFLLWAARRGRKLSRNEVGDRVAAVEDWRAGVVAPLRAARRSLRSPPLAMEAAGAANLRLLVKKVELEAERLQQRALAFLSPLEGLGEAAPPDEAAAANVATYAQVLGRSFQPGSVSTILAAFNTPGGAADR